MKLILRTPHLRAQAIRAIQAIPANEVMDFTLVPHKSSRSLEQNARYWSLLTEISEQLWPDGKQYEPEIYHEYFKGRFLGKVQVNFGENDDAAFVPKSTTKLAVKDFGDFMTQVEAWGVEHGVKFTEWREI